MRFQSVVAAMVCSAAAVGVPAAAGWAAPPAEPGPRAVADAVMHGVVQPKSSPVRAARTSANMTYHGGRVMPSATVRAIFWGTSWAGYAGDKVTGLDTFYAGEGDSSYAKTVDEYTDAVAGGHTVGAGLAYQGHLVDTSTASSGARTQTILNEVAKEVDAGLITLDPGGTTYVPVYTDLPRGSAGYCAYHSSGTVNGIAVQFGFFWKLDGDPGCDPGDTTTGHSEGLAAAANVSAHELSEARSDPASPGAWYDSRGSENGDKCAWTFNVLSVALSNGSVWRLQGEWSNAAFSAGTGYLNSSRQPGCLDGH